jgi:hypothetical protein
VLCYSSLMVTLNDTTCDELARWATEMAYLPNARNWDAEEVAISADWHFGKAIDQGTAVALRLAIRTLLRERGDIRP